MYHQEQVHYPKILFVCGFEKGTEPCGEIFRKRGHVEFHLKALHKVPDDDSITRNLLRVLTYGIFHDRWGFGPCKEGLNSWDKSMNHIFEHVEKGCGRND